MKIAGLLLFPFILSSCAINHLRSDYAGPRGKQEVSLDVRQERATQEHAEALRQLGLTNVELSDFHRMLVDNRIRLNRMENNLRTETEKRQYYIYKPLLKTDEQRILFLGLPSLEERERVAAQWGLNANNTDFSAYEKDAIVENDVFIGMSKKAVRESWGDPETVEVAGNPIYGNERWRYSTYISTPEGFNQENRVLYFEGGRLVGWQKR